MRPLASTDQRVCLGYETRYVPRSSSEQNSFVEFVKSTWPTISSVQVGVKLENGVWKDDNGVAISFVNFTHNHSQPTTDKYARIKISEDYKNQWTVKKHWILDTKDKIETHSVIFCVSKPLGKFAY